MSFMSSIAKFFASISPIPLPKAAGERPSDGSQSRPQTEQVFTPRKAVGFVTRYGYPTDSTPDSLTRAGLGAWDNHLDSDSLAVSRDVEASFRASGIKPLAFVELTLVDGTRIRRRWADRTAAFYGGRRLVGRFDIYCPGDENKQLDGKSVISFSPVS